MVAKGIQFLVNAKGEKSAVVIDLRRHGALWEDIYDLIVARMRKAEPRLSWEEVRVKSSEPVRKRA